MRSLALIVTLLTFSNSPASAAMPNTWAIGLSPTTTTQDLGDFRFKTSPYVTAWGGLVRQPRSFGYYFNAALPLKTDDWRYTYTMLNAGVNLPITQNAVWFVGAGISMEEPRISDNWGYTYRIRENNDQLNINAGAMYFYREYGLSIGYNSASGTFDIGVAVRF